MCSVGLVLFGPYFTYDKLKAVGPVRVSSSAPASLIHVVAAGQSARQPAVLEYKLDGGVINKFTLSQ